MTTGKKWYEQTIPIVLLLIFFFPVGLYLLWKYTTWAKWLKVTISVVVGISAISILSNPSDETKQVDVSQTNDQQTSQVSENSKPEPEQKAVAEVKPYAYDWSEETKNTYWLLVKDFDNSAPDFKERAKATIIDFKSKVSFTTNTLVGLTSSPKTFKCETLASKSNYTIQKYIACLDEAGGKDAYNAETSANNVALYSNEQEYNLDATKCSKDCSEIVFYPDTPAGHEFAKYKETLKWKP